MSLSIISDLRYQLALIPRVDPPMTGEMEDKCTAFIDYELKRIHASLLSVELSPDYHLLHICAPPNLSPVNIIHILREGVSTSMHESFRELDGWGCVYHEKALVKSCAEITTADLREFIDIVLGGI